MKTYTKNNEKLKEKMKYKEKERMKKGEQTFIVLNDKDEMKMKDEERGKGNVV